MKALRFYDIQDLRYEEADDPVITAPDEVIVKVKAVGICGSDIARYRSLGPYTRATCGATSLPARWWRPERR